MKAKLQQAIASYSSTFTDTCAVHVQSSTRRHVHPAQLLPTNWTRMSVLYNFNPLICQMHKLWTCTSLRPKTMVGTPKTTSQGRSPDHVIIPYKKTSDFEKR